MADNDMVWADIPVVDLERASKFYAHVLGKPVAEVPGMDGVALVGMPVGQGDAPPPSGGEVIVSVDLYKGGTPSMDGPTIYFSSYGDIDGMIERVREAGGEILQEKQNMGEMVGWIAFFKDTEGNRIGIQQPSGGM